MSGRIHRPLGHIPSYSVRCPQPEYFRFVILDWVYQFRALPFEVLSAPLICTQVRGGDHQLCTPLRGAGAYMYLEDCLSRSLGRVICSGSRSSFWISAGTWEFTSILPVQSGSQQGLSCWGFSSSGYRSFASCGGSVTPPAATHSQFSPQTCSVGASVDGVIGSLTSMTYQVPLGVSGHDRTDLPQFNPQETMYSDKSLPGWGARLDFEYGIRQLASTVSRLGDLLVGVGGNPSGIASFHSSMEDPICSGDVPQSFGGCVHPQTTWHSIAESIRLYGDILLLRRLTNIRLRCRYVPGGLTVHAVRSSL